MGCNNYLRQYIYIYIYTTYAYHAEYHCCKIILVEIVLVHIQEIFIHFVLMAGTRTLFLEFLTLDESNFKLNNFSNNNSLSSIIYDLINILRSLSQTGYWQFHRKIIFFREEKSFGKFLKSSLKKLGQWTIRDEEVTLMKTNDITVNIKKFKFELLSIL